MMGEEIRIDEVGTREMEFKRAMAVEVLKEKVYPPRLHTHEDVVNRKALFMDSLRRFHASMGTKFSYVGLAMLLALLPIFSSLLYCVYRFFFMLYGL